MSQPKEFRGYYCRRCHAYSRLFPDERSTGFRGTCPRCGIEILVGSEAAEHALFFSGGRKFRTINLWDSYRRGKIIGEVEAGTKARVLSSTDYKGVTWYHVRTGGKSGWVSGAFIRPLR